MAAEAHCKSYQIINKVIRACFLDFPIQLEKRQKIVKFPKCLKSGNKILQILDKFPVTPRGSLKGQSENVLKTIICPFVALTLNRLNFYVLLDFQLETFKQMLSASTRLPVEPIILKSFHYIAIFEIQKFPKMSKGQFF
jgi:hypothetical protein